MGKIYKDHHFDYTMDFGVIGERCVEFLYDWHEPNPSNDPFLAPENGGVVINDALLFIDGREVSVLHWLSPSTLDKVISIIHESWQ